MSVNFFDSTDFASLIHQLRNHQSYVLNSKLCICSYVLIRHPVTNSKWIKKFGYSEQEEIEGYMNKAIQMSGISGQCALDYDEKGHLIVVHVFPRNIKRETKAALKDTAKELIQIPITITSRVVKLIIFAAFWCIVFRLLFRLF